MGMVIKEHAMVASLQCFPHSHMLECVHCTTQPEFGVWSFQTLASAHVLHLPTTQFKYFKQS